MRGGVGLCMVAVCLLGVSCNRRREPAAQAEPMSKGDSGAARDRAQPYQAPLLSLARQNQEFRRVVFTGARMQVVLMSIPPDGDIGEEAHARVEQALFCVAGSGTAIINGVASRLAPGDAVVVPLGAKHNFRNTGKEPLQLYTIYSPPNHIDGRVHHTQADAKADREDEEFGRRVEGP